MKPFITLFILLLAPGIIYAQDDFDNNYVTNLPKEANQELQETGQIEFVNAWEETLPLETYIANNSQPIISVCEMVKGLGAPVEDKQWRTAINESLKAIYEKDHYLAYKIAQYFQEKDFYFININVKDSKEFINNAFLKGAIGKNDIYVLSSTWKNYRTNAQTKYPFQAMLTHIYHEALWDRQFTYKYNLGKVIVELLRLSGHYDPNGGHEKFNNENDWKLFLESNARYLSSHDDDFYPLFHDHKGPEASNIPNKSKYDKNSPSENWNEFLAKWKEYQKFLENNKITIVKAQYTYPDNEFDAIKRMKLNNYSDPEVKQIEILSGKDAYIAEVDKVTNEPITIKKYQFNKHDWDRIKPIIQKAPQLCAQ